MFVAASTECFPQLTLRDALERLTDLEFSSVEILIREGTAQLSPTQVTADLEQAVNICRNTHRLDVVAYNVDIAAEGELFYEQFTACCKLAKASKVVTMVVPSSELGTPFNEEVEKLRKMVGIASREGVVVGMRSQIGRLSQDPDTVMVLCNNVPNLGVTLDPSQYIAGPAQGKRYEQLYKFAVHTHLRDSTKSQVQVRVGQGEIEYGRVISNLKRYNYNRSLCVHISEMPEADQNSELRKLRLLLESSL